MTETVTHEVVSSDGYAERMAARGYFATGLRLCAAHSELAHRDSSEIERLTGAVPGRVSRGLTASAHPCAACLLSTGEVQS